MPGLRSAANEVGVSVGAPPATPARPFPPPQQRFVPGRQLPWLLPLYGVLWVLAFLVSSTYWFLPVGLRVAALLRVAPRHWLWLGLAEWASVVVLFLIRPHGGAFTWTGFFMGVMAPWVIYAAAIGFWRRRESGMLPTTPQSLTRLLLVGLAAAALVSAELQLLRLIEMRVTVDRLTASYFSYLIGDFIGVLILAPILLQLGDPHAAWRRAQVWRDLARTLLPLALALWMVRLGEPAAVPYVALFAIVPPLWLAQRSGWRGAALAVTGVSAIVYAGTLNLLAEDVRTLIQLFLAIVGAVALVFGGWVGLERRLRAELEAGVEELEHANRQLEAQAAEMRDLGQRLVTAQEDERRRIRGELRGELSQQITALGTQLALLVRRVDRPELMAMVDGLRTHVQAIRDAADQCLDSLQPRAMMRAGLRGALLDGPLAGMLGSAGIAYSVHLDGDDRQLAEDDQLTVYRVAQHLVAAVLRYSDAAAMELRVVVVGEPPEGVEIDAVLGWRTPLSVEALAAEPDIQAVRDRMFACGGLLELDALGEGRLRLLLRFAPRSAALRSS
jgi:glucose-6-phosphate-specific signal transduction histidine kinase